jgi:hypothetical protein
MLSGDSASPLSSLLSLPKPPQSVLLQTVLLQMNMLLQAAALRQFFS